MHTLSDGDYRGDGWLGSGCGEAGLPVGQAVTDRTPSRASPLPQAACAARPRPKAAEIPHKLLAQPCLDRRLQRFFISCLRSHA